MFLLELKYGLSKQMELTFEAEDCLNVIKNSVRISKRTLHLTITKINRLMLFKEIMAAYSENHTKPIHTKCSITDCQSRLVI
jgi:hypothetical protein